jgi:hypothetical protein
MDLRLRATNYYEAGCNSLRAGNFNTALENFMQGSLGQLSALERLTLSAKLTWCRARGVSPSNSSSQIRRDVVDQAFVVLRQCVNLSTHVRERKAIDELIEAIVTSANTCLEYGTTIAQMSRCAGNLATAMTRLCGSSRDDVEAASPSSNFNLLLNSKLYIPILITFRIAVSLGGEVPDARSSFPFVDHFFADEFRRRMSRMSKPVHATTLSLSLSLFGQHSIALWLLRALDVMQVSLHACRRLVLTRSSYLFTMPVGFDSSFCDDVTALTVQC